MTIDIERVDHIGIRVAELERALSFYQVLGFDLFHEDTNDGVVIIRNSHDVEINLIYNANDDNGGANILMDVENKYPGYTHVALRVGSIKATMEALVHRLRRMVQAGAKRRAALRGSWVNHLSASVH